LNPGATNSPCRRILVVDDNLAIHDDIHKILCPLAAANKAIEAREAALFGEPSAAANKTVFGHGCSFEMDSAYQGQEALGLVRNALKKGRPYMMAFMDVRMPPGWDGLETAVRIWEVDPRIQVVIATAYSDYTWEQTTEKLGLVDKYVILKKPFEAIEVLQLANACTEKWMLERRIEERERKLQELEERVRDRTTELAETHLRFEHLFRSSPAVIYSLKPNGHDQFTFISQNVETVLGCHPARFIETPQFWSQRVHPEDAAVFREHRFQLTQGAFHAAEYRFQHQEGTYRWLHDEARLIRDPHGAPVEIVGCCTDVTAHKRAENDMRLQIMAIEEAEQALQAMEARLRQKLEAVGQLAADVTQVLQTQAELLRAARGSAINPELIAKAEVVFAGSDPAYLSEDVPIAIQQTLDGIERITGIVRRLKELSHPNGDERSTSGSARSAMPDSGFEAVAHKRD
jgi:PAS domain S-box-containing protein